MILNGILPVFYADDLSSAIEFYTEILGFSVAMSHPDEEKPEFVVLDHDAVSIMYGKAGSMPRSTGQLNFDVDDVRDVLRVLPDSIEPEWGPKDFPYGRREVAIRDPNGILLVFSQPSD